MLASGLQLYLKRDASAGVFLWTYLHFKYDIRYFVVYYDFISIWLRLSCAVGLNVDIHSVAADEPLCVCVCFFLLFFIYFVLDSALYFRRLTLFWIFHVRGVFDVRWSTCVGYFINYGEFCWSIEICLRPATLLKKRLQHRCFAVNFGKFLR